MIIDRSSSSTTTKDLAQGEARRMKHEGGRGRLRSWRIVIYRSRCELPSRPQHPHHALGPDSKIRPRSQSVLVETQARYLSKGVRVSAAFERMGQ
jgi:hypothetical protein